MQFCKVCGAKASSEYCFRHKPRKRIRTKAKRGTYFAVYLEAFGYDLDDRPICEITGRPADQIHHLVPRSKQGQDVPENLIALIQEIHDLVENRERRINELLKTAHQLFTDTKKPLYVTDPALCSTIMECLST
jgi:5-methylcytosine-specific restriction endonuclease McrA